jgi:hypothetical protein
VAVLAVELGELGFEVRAGFSHDLLRPHEVLPGEHGMPVLRDEDQVRVQSQNAVPSDKNICSHRP